LDTVMDRYRPGGKEAQEPRRWKTRLSQLNVKAGVANYLIPSLTELAN
jgi:hypothetical protein